MQDDYTALAAALRLRRIQTYFQAPDQLVVSRQPGPAYPDCGNSFWLSKQHGDWYLGTWAPCYYHVPAGADVVALCEAFLDVGTSAQATLPASLMERFGLNGLSNEEAAERFDW